MIPPLDAVLLVLVVASAAAALEGRDPLAALILFGVFSFQCAAFYALEGAPDVSFTEAALGATMATVFFVAAIHGTTPMLGPRHPPKGGRFSLAVLLAAGAALGLAARGLPVTGDPEAPAAAHVSPRYIERGAEETGARNLVTGVVVDYRGYDTLGEAFVLLTAGLACLLIIPAAWLGRREDAS
ncbi:MAG: DUF4040 domain-containing protein [Elusimicrobiota bacterium]|nr:DUF4040 domain-containing protein [Elusimicrobiota bacterium]